MNEIKAFVGYSYDEKDKTVTTTFLDYFDQLKKMDIGFTWDHAREAQPSDLAVKVKSIIQDKNLFIGICTKKERVIHNEEIKPCWFCKQQLKSNKNNFLWKTSDWIIQEIGLAIGRDMDLILLLEEEVRLPGGLQGNLEFIPFKSDNPEKSFGRILEMIRSLKPKITKPPITMNSEKNVQEEIKEDDSWWQQPKFEWTYDQFREALLKSIGSNNTEIEEKINKAYISKVGEKSDEAVKWTAIVKYIQLSSGGNISLDEIKSLVSNNSQIIELKRILGKSYEFYNEYEKAAKEYRSAADQALKTEEKLMYLNMSAIAFCRADKNSFSKDIIEQMKNEILASGKGEKFLLFAIKEIAKRGSDMNTYYGVSERLLELNPDDSELRFELAYEYSQFEEHQLSLFHYLRIPELSRGTGTWNNLAVQFDQFKLTASAINSYYKAEALNNTLAMSNIANKYINAGFLKEAEIICKKALAINDCHENIHRSMTRIKEIPDEEKKIEDEIVKNTIKFSDFYKEFGNALSKNFPKNLCGKWKGPKCNLNIDIQGDQFIAEGRDEYFINSYGLVQLFDEGKLKEDTVNVKYYSKYEGIIQGKAITASVINEEVTDKPIIGRRIKTSLGPVIKKSVLMIVFDSGNEIQVYDKEAPESERFYKLTRNIDGN